MFFNLIINFSFVEATFEVTSRETTTSKETTMLRLLILLLKMFSFIQIESKRARFFFFAFLECLNFFSRIFKIWIKRKIFQSLSDFHQIKFEFNTWRVKYLLKMQFKSRVIRLEFFARSIFFKSRRRWRLNFREKKSNFEIYYFSMYIVSNHLYDSWDSI
jgi:hypothetical protein